MSLQENINLAQQVDIALLLCSLGLASVFLFAWQLRKAVATRTKLKAIPMVRSSGIISSWIDAFRFVFHVKEIIEEGHRVHYGSAFKVPLFNRWMIVVSGSEKINDIWKASSEQLSLKEAGGELLQTDYTIGHHFIADSYHTDIIQSTLTCNIRECFVDVQDEIQVAFKDNIPMTEDWIEVPMYTTILQIVCRASNRMFVGLPLCCNPNYIKLNINSKAADPLHVVRIIGSIFTPCSGAAAKMEKFLGQTIQEQLHQDDVHGKYWPGKPNDLLLWLIDVTKGQSERRTVKDLIVRILGLNFAAIHMTSMTVTIMLFALAAHPEYIQILRDEVETAITAEGTTKAAMGKMHKLDSFVKETQRLYGGFGVSSMLRLVKKDLVFLDGTVVPAGNHITAASYSTHMDEENYEDPLEFKPWRFSDKRKEAGKGIRHQMVTTSLDYLLFGGGRPACLGRFFTINELKALMAHVLLNFDMKMDKVPETGWFLSDRFPNHSSKVLFRKRMPTVKV
ncbi:cytochrome P450 [Armillaria luteobubalina]|uniref:Cytochrome P450 n=1 Tax=Armillaria luteobubalina TaxID=153913 RepID=A0AA39PZV6_9AGAR|nr:cytochrome P450 [Armillaria luteobubalina]